MIEELRREAYIDALFRSETQMVVSLFGVIPWEIFYAFDVLPISAYGIDYFVVEKERAMCSTMNATVEYHLHDRCPFMNVSSYYFVDTYCEERKKIVQKYFDPVVVYEDIPQLISVLETLTKKSLDEKKLHRVVEQSKALSEEIYRLRSANLSAESINYYQYDSKFIFDLEKRLQYLKNIEKGEWTEHSVVYLQQIAGVDEEVHDVIIEGEFCEGERHIRSQKEGIDFLKEKYIRTIPVPDYTIHRCPKFNTSTIYYKGEKHGR